MRMIALEQETVKLQVLANELENIQLGICPITNAVQPGFLTCCCQYGMNNIFKNEWRMRPIANTAASRFQLIKVSNYALNLLKLDCSLSSRGSSSLVENLVKY